MALGVWAVVTASLLQFDADACGLARDRLNAALRKSHRPAVERPLLFRLATAERQCGNYPAAVQHFARVAKDENDGLAKDALVAAAEISLFLKHYDDAQTFFTQERLTPGGREAALWGLGWTSFRKQEYADARRFFAAVIRESPYAPLAAAAAYWSARTREEQGEKSAAAQEYVALIKKFPLDYYAYQSVRRLGESPWPDADVDEEPTRDTDVAQLLSIARLGVLRRTHSGLEQLLQQRERLGPTDLSALEGLARQLDNSRIADLFSATRNQRFADNAQRLATQFSSPYVTLARLEAARQKIPGDVLVALIKHESDFNTQKVANNGALGLMQLNPKIARDLIREDNRRVAPKEFLTPELNVALGARYFGRLLRSFDGRIEYALAAYHAGPAAVTAWSATSKDVPAEIFIEEIPDPQTRDYVRRVFAQLQTFRYVQKLPPWPMISRLTKSSPDRR